MPSDEYFLTKQFFEKMTEDGEAHVKLSFTEFKHSKINNEYFLDPIYRTVSMSNNLSILNIWKRITVYDFYIEKIKYCMTYYERLVSIKIILRYLSQNGFPLEKYLKIGNLVTGDELINIGFQILDNLDYRLNTSLVESNILRMLGFGENRGMYYMDIRITNDFWEKYLILPKNHENHMRIVYDINESTKRYPSSKYVRNTLFDVDLKAYELDERNDPSILFGVSVDSLLNHTIDNRAEYF